MTLDDAVRGLRDFRRRKLGELAIERKLIHAGQLEAWEHGEDLIGAEALNALEAALDALPARPAPIPAEAASGTPFAEDYLLVREIGRGGSGRVWKAWERRLGRWVAIKLLPEDAPEETRERFAREARAAASLRHPHVVTIHHGGTWQGRPYLVMEYIEGRPLSSVDALRKAALGLEAAHQAGVLHRDVKPANILVDERGEPHVVDFGLVRFLDEGRGPTRAGAVMGTPAYMAPEQVEGRVAELGPATDVYGLGAVLYELLAGHAPFRGGSDLEIYRKILAEDPPAPPGPRDLVAICLQALAKSPSRRYATAGAFAEDLRRQLAGERVAARPPGALDRLGRALKRRALPLAAGLIVLAAGAMVVSARRSLEVYQASTHAGMELWNRASALVPGGRAIAEGLLERAIAEFERAGRAEPSRPEPWLMIGRVQLLRGRGDEAQEAWAEALKRDPGYAPALFERGKFVLGHYLRLRGVPSARLRRGALRFAPASPESPEERAWRRRAEAELQAARGKTGAAEQQYLEGALAFGAGRPADAARLLGSYLDSCPWDAGASALRGVALFQAGDGAAAEEALTQALRLDDRPAWRAARAQVRFSLGRYEDALSDVPLRDDAVRAPILQALGRLPEAEACATRAIEAHPESSDPYAVRGAIRVAARDLDGAEKDFQEAVRLRPLDAGAYGNLGNVLLLDGRADEAIEEYGAAIQIAPEDADAWLNRGVARRSKSDHAGAIADFREALKRAPSDPDALCELAESLVATGEPGPAAEALRRALASASASWPRRKSAERLLERLR